MKLVPFSVKLLQSYSPMVDVVVYRLHTESARLLGREFGTLNKMCMSKECCSRFRVRTCGHVRET